MKIRELDICRLRNFPPEGRRISFVDAFSDRPRQFTVLVGSNGSGKTTVLQVIASLLAQTAREPGFEFEFNNLTHMRATFESDSGEAHAIGESRIELHAFARYSLPDRTDMLIAEPRPGTGAIHQFIAKMKNGSAPMTGGAIYLPHARELGEASSTQIAEVESERCYVARADETQQDSLAAFWLWQNYLDLEAQAEGRPNLSPFIEAIEDLLGRGQRVRIKRGRVTIMRPHLRDVIEPHELPSGELQILTMFGELLRHLRPGAIVLIDELELSLHPALQRAVVHKLRALARKHDLQVIVTTHSMEIVSAVAPEEVVSLDDILLQEGITPGEKAG